MAKKYKGMELEMHYNSFATISEQLTKFDIDKKDLERFEKIKKCILMLYYHNIVTETQKTKCFEKLHKQIEKSIKGVKVDG